MAKKKSKGLLNKYSLAIVFILTVISVAMLFVKNVVNDSAMIAVEFTGLQIVFGYAEKAGALSVQILNFSILACLAYALPIVGFVMLALFKDSGKVFGLIIAIVFVVGAILAFLLPSFVIANNGQAVSGLKLGVGAIVSAIASILSAVLVLAKTLLK